MTFMEGLMEETKAIRKKSLSEEILDKSAGKISPEVARQLGDQIIDAVEKLKKSEVTIRKSCAYGESSDKIDIFVCTAFISAAMKIILNYQHQIHGCAGKLVGTKGYEEEGICLLGKIKFGKKDIYESFNDGVSTRTPREKEGEPDFEPNSPFVALIQKHSWNATKGNLGDSYDRYEYRVIIYIPSNTETLILN